MLKLAINCLGGVQKQMWCFGLENEKTQQSLLKQKHGPVVYK
jgi:hypothetical protein